jgi:hypothetical protein
VAHSHTPRNRCVRFVFGIAAASRNTRFRAARCGLTWAGLAPADRASFAGAFAYSITSSARARKDSGIVRPIAFAAFRFDGPLEFRRLFDRHIHWLVTLKDLLHKQCHVLIQGATLVAIRHQSTHFGK